MTTTEGQSPARVLQGQVGESGWGRFVLNHDGWPGWTFALTLNKAGRQVGFEMYGDGEAAGTERLTRLRSQAGTLVPASDAPEVTKRRIRQVPFQDLEHAALSWVRRAQRAHATAHAKEMLSRLPAARAPRVKKNTWSREELAALCAEYVALIEDEENPDPAPVRTLASRHPVGEKRIRNLVSSARGDLLTAPPAGRAGGQLTDKAKEILSGHHQAP